MSVHIDVIIARIVRDLCKRVYCNDNKCRYGVVAKRLIYVL
jgi:hypothetical protein